MTITESRQFINYLFHEGLISVERFEGIAKLTDLQIKEKAEELEDRGYGEEIPPREGDE